MAAPRRTSPRRTRPWLRHTRRPAPAAGRIFYVVLFLLGIGGTAAFAAATPVYSTADETAHVDYAYQVWQGALPVFEHGVGFALEVGSVPPVQWASQHPPLFYALTAPVVGPFLDAGHPVMAGLAARAFMVALSGITIVASSWMASVVVPQLRHLRLVVPVVLACSVWFTRLGGAVYNDMLTILCSVLMVGTTVNMMRKGFTWRRTAALAVVAAASSLARLSMVPVVLAAVSVLVVALLIRGGTRRLDWLWAALVPAGAVVATSGWFYARNVALTGSITGGHPEWSQEHLGRVTRSFGEVLTDPNFWRIMANQFAYSSQLISWGRVLLFLVPLAAGIVVAVWFILTRVSGGRARAIESLVLVLLVGTIAGVSVMQVMYATGGGAINGRYLAAVLPHLCLLVAVGLGWWGRAVIPVLSAWIAFRFVDLFLDLSATLERYASGTNTGVYPAVVWIGFGVLALGVCGALVGLAGDKRGGSGADRSPAGAM